MFEADRIETDADGRIRGSSDVFILTPKDPARGNGILLFEFINRGNKRALQFFNNGAPGNDTRTMSDAGNGRLLGEGYTLVVVAWQGDVPRGDGRMSCALPGYVDDAPTRIAAEFIVEDEATRVLPLSTKTGTRSYPAASLDTSAARLTRRRYPDAPAEEIGADDWAFERNDGDAAGLGAGDVMAAEQAIVPCARHLHLFGGFRPGWVHTLEYDAEDALAIDVGFVLISETLGFLRHGGAGNPLAGAIRHAIGWGRSQSGRAIRDFLWRGFNADHAGRCVFDGMLPHISGGGKTNMNRFTNLVVAASPEYEDRANPSDQFPYSYAESTDHVSGARDAILRHPGTDPKVIHTQTSSEYWYRRGSLVHTDTEGRDLEQPESVRIYIRASAQHWADTRVAPPVKGPCREYFNNVHTAPFFPATLTLMRRWLTDGGAPPPSRIPSVTDGTLVGAEDLPGAVPRDPRHASAAGRERSAGSRLRPRLRCRRGRGASAARDRRTPRGAGAGARRAWQRCRGAAGADGRGAPGQLHGWNLRGRGMLFSFMGSYIPLPETPEEAALTGDPRPAITELYPTPAAYSEAILKAVCRLIAEGFLLPQARAEFAALSARYGAANHHHRI
ncbi:alpha/beta hydrolase domain-containing protein [Roseicyclus sp. F158]|uniref:Alpha/beta hydrolase domain-containing protein n=1 Tax=Tropicimonas omnivorans TaxID=3075590 RepID=A0ABU3DHB1_9RHOB|nr:alpha/beta hydrolase domain-containing protein [Roseicyclus sp. F158]MDT0683108.1 alpha/beta hydrolase domain-containing protein [Roseicyclus sp. F158]